MSRFDALAFAVRGLVLVLAWLLVRRRLEFRPAAVFLSIVAVIDAARFAVAHTVLARPGPYAGIDRLAFHLDAAGFLSWPFGIVALALVVFLRRSPLPAIATWAVVSLALAAAYPTLHGAGLGRVYSVVDALAIIVSLVAAGMWFRRRERPRPETAVAALLAMIDAAMLFGPYAPSADPFTGWGLAQAGYAALWAVIALVLTGSLIDDFLLVEEDR